MSAVTPVETVYLGIGVGHHAIHITSSLGQRTAITTERLRAPEDWVELATYGIALPDHHRLLACVALPSGHSREHREEVVDAARVAGWDGVLLVSLVHAVGRGLLAVGHSEEGDDLPLVVVDPAVTSVGLIRGRPLGLLADDPVRPIPGREAREVAVSLRCLLKERERDELPGLLRRAVVAGDEGEVERVGRRVFERELEALGIERVDFELDPFLPARGAELIAAEASPQAWRRTRRRRY